MELPFDKRVCIGSDVVTSIVIIEQFKYLTKDQILTFLHRLDGTELNLR